MTIDLTPEELEVVRFALKADLETVNSGLSEEHEFEEWQTDKQLLTAVLNKLG